jgi:site-specific DNA-adenine methylase
MKVITKGNYEAKIRMNAEGSFAVSFGYRDGEQVAAVPGLKVKHYDTEKNAIAAANRGLAKL